MGYSPEQSGALKESWEMTGIGTALQQGLRDAFYRRGAFHTLRERRLQSLLAHRIESAVLDGEGCGPAIYGQVPGLGRQVQVGRVQEEVSPSGFQIKRDCMCYGKRADPPHSDGKEKKPKSARFDIVVLQPTAGQTVSLALGAGKAGDILEQLPLDSLRAIVEVKAGPFPAIQDSVFSDLCRLLDLAQDGRRECHFVFADKRAKLFSTEIDIQPSQLIKLHVPAWDEQLTEETWGQVLQRAQCSGIKNTALRAAPPEGPHVMVHLVGSEKPIMRYLFRTGTPPFSDSLSETNAHGIASSGMQGTD